MSLLPVQIKYQGFFRPIQSLIKRVFFRVNPALQPRCFLIGVPNTPPHELFPESSEPWVIGPCIDPKSTFLQDMTRQFPQLSTVRTIQAYMDKKAELEAEALQNNIMPTDQSIYVR